MTSPNFPFSFSPSRSFEQKMKYAQIGYDSIAKSVVANINKLQLWELHEDEIPTELSSYRSQIGFEGQKVATIMVFDKLIDLAAQKEMRSSQQWESILTNQNIQEVSASFIFLYKLLMIRPKSDTLEDESGQVIRQELIYKLMNLMLNNHSRELWRGIYDKIYNLPLVTKAQVIDTILTGDCYIKHEIIPDLVGIVSQLIARDAGADDVYSANNLQELISLIAKLIELTPKDEREELCAELLELSRPTCVNILNIAISLLTKRKEQQEKDLETERISTPPPSPQFGSSPSLLTAMLGNFKEIDRRRGMWSRDIPKLLYLFKLVFKNEIDAQQIIDQNERRVFKRIINSYDRAETHIGKTKFIEKIEMTPPEKRKSEIQKLYISQASELALDISLLKITE